MNEQTPAENYAAIMAAWMNPGPQPRYHRAMQREVHKAMPVLAAALERACLDALRQGRAPSADDTGSHREAPQPGGQRLTR